MVDAHDGLRILQVNTADNFGGAARVAWNLHQGYRERGHHSWLVVGQRVNNAPDVFTIPNDHRRRGLARIADAAGNVLTPLVGKVRGVGRIRNLINTFGDPSRWWSLRMGHEDFDFPGTWRVPALAGERPDVVHCHNLHGGYFDLRVLPWLSRQFPVVLTLHDAWLISGHCAHSFDCERWKTGCGECPDLTIYPAIRRDATAFNWQRKQRIYAQSRLYVTAPSRWLIQKVEQSMLVPSIVKYKVIHNGIDLSVFTPADRNTVRASLGIPQDAKVLLFAANCVRGNIWKDYATMRAAIEEVSRRLQGQDVLFIALGEDAGWERIGHARIHFVAYQKDPAVVARYYQAADVYLHAARADTFPNSVLEALACGVPVVATAVGGIPEQVHDSETGFLIPPGDVGAMSERLVQLLLNKGMKEALGDKAAQDARARFDLRQQVDATLEWYQEILRAERRGVDVNGTETSSRLVNDAATSAA